MQIVSKVTKVRRALLVAIRATGLCARRQAVPDMKALQDNINTPKELGFIESSSTYKYTI